MEKYTIYCTGKQTKRAYELGSPIEVVPSYPTCSVLSHTMMIDDDLVRIPTAEQMVGWLRENKGILICPVTTTHVGLCKANIYISAYNHLGDWKLYTQLNDSRKYPQAILAAIDAALDYLEKGE